MRLDESDIGDRPLWVKAGKEQLIIPLCSENAVRRTQPVSDLLAELTNEEGQSNAYVFAELWRPAECSLAISFRVAAP